MIFTRSYALLLTTLAMATSNCYGDISNSVVSPVAVPVANSVAKPIVKPETTVDSASAVLPVLTEEVELAIRGSGLLGLSDQVRQRAQQLFEVHPMSVGKRYKIAFNLSQKWSSIRLQEACHKAWLALSPEHRQQVLVSMGDPFNVEVRQREATAIKEVNSAKYKQYRRKLAKEPLRADRLALIDELNKVQAYSSLLVVSNQAVANAFQENDVEIRPEYLNSERARTLDAKHFLMYLHRETSDERLKQLIALWKTSGVQTWLADIQNTLVSD